MDAVAEIGQPAPTFVLQDLEERTCALENASGKVVALTFWSAECPWSRKADEYIEREGLAAAWGPAVLHWRIASNVNESLEDLRRAAGERSVSPVLVDEEHRVADLFGAMTTPHVFVIDGEGILRYGGALNDATWREPEPERNYLAEAVEAARQGESPEPAERPGRGCTIVRYRAE